MKKFCLTFLAYLLVCLFPLKSASSNRVSILKHCCVVASLNDSLPNHSKSKLALFIDNVWYNGDASKKDHASIVVDYFLVNNTNDTLRYKGNRNLLAQSFLTTDANIIIGENSSPRDTTHELVILPHKGSYRWFLKLKLRRTPDTTFNIKVGVRLVSWSGNNNHDAVNNPVDEKPDTIWSDMEEIKTNGKHGSYNQTQDEYEARSLKRPLWAFFPKLTEDEKKSYTLSIDQSKISKWKDTIITRPDIKKRKTVTQHYLFTTFPAKFTNNSADTLRYINMDCSWQELYRVNDDAFSIKEGMFDCYKNEPAEFTVLSHQSFTIYIPVETAVAAKRHQKIKIGMSMQKYISYDQLLLFGLNEERLVSEPELSNMIWSNEVEIP